MNIIKVLSMLKCTFSCSCVCSYIMHDIYMLLFTCPWIAILEVADIFHQTQ